MSSRRRTGSGLFAGSSPELIKRLKALKIGGQPIIDNDGYVRTEQLEAADQILDSKPVEREPEEIEQATNLWDRERTGSWKVTVTRTGENPAFVYTPADADLRAT